MGQVLELYKFEDHLRDCDQRYNGVIERIDSIDQRLGRMEQLLLDIKYSLRPSDYDQD
jgi:hypothetical protein